MTTVFLVTWLPRIAGDRKKCGDCNNGSAAISLECSMPMAIVKVTGKCSRLPTMYGCAATVKCLPSMHSGKRSVLVPAFPLNVQKSPFLRPPFLRYAQAYRPDAAALNWEHSFKRENVMRLVNWNIQWGRGVDGRVDLARIVREARALCDFDVLCLQEVTRGFHA